mgnify:FL=1
MYAVIKTGGKQYRVQEGDTLRVEKLDGNVGDTITFSEVLMIGGETPKVGLPFVESASVVARIVEHGRGRKVISFKKRPRGWKKIRGHRQAYTALKIEKIVG